MYLFLFMSLCHFFIIVFIIIILLCYFFILNTTRRSYVFSMFQKFYVYGFDQVFEILTVTWQD